MDQTITIGNRKIGINEPCFIIAEVGVNHNGSIELAKKLIDAAVEARVDAVKFQTFKSEKIVTPSAKMANYQVKNTLKDESQYQMLKKVELNYKEFEQLFDYCKKNNIIFLSTPHSCKEDVDLVTKLCPTIKVGSGDLTNLPILKYIAEQKLPIILSTGMSNLEEIKEAIEIIKPINKEIILLHATTNYPTPLNEVNLNAMNTLKSEFEFIVGYSDHTEGINVSIAAVAMGAKIIEKHFTLDKTMPGPDHKASLDPEELKALVDKIRKIEKINLNAEKVNKIIDELEVNLALGDGIKKPAPSEFETMNIVRKSIVAAKNISKGDVITEDNISIKRPNTGLKPKYYWEILGKRVNHNIQKDEPLQLLDLN